MDQSNDDVPPGLLLPPNGGNAALCRRYAERDTQAILSLRGEDGDAIALLPGWTNSTGAAAELALARWVKLRVLDARDFGDYARVVWKGDL